MSRTLRNDRRDPDERWFPYVPRAVPVTVQPELFQRNHAAIHQAAPGTCQPCDLVRVWYAANSAH